MGLKVSNPKAHDFPLGKELVEEFVNTYGIGKIHWLIMDRGYLDGEWIGKLKTEYKINALIPVRSNMEILKDAVGISSFKETKWKEYEKEIDKDKKVIRKSEVTWISNLETWQECPIPLNMILSHKKKISRKVKLLTGV